MREEKVKARDANTSLNLRKRKQSKSKQRTVTNQINLKKCVSSEEKRLKSLKTMVSL